MSHSSYDLTQGGIVKKLLVVASPIIANQLAMLLYNTTDMFWLGRVGSNAVAAAGAAGMFTWLSQGFLTIPQMGAQIGVSQSVGQGDKKAALDYFQNAFSLSIVIALVFAALMILFNEQLIGFYHYKEADVSANASSYLLIVAIMMPGTFITNVINGAFQGAGNTRIPFVVNLCGLLTNVALDPLFIFTLDMGVAGAAIATAISQFVSLVVLCIIILKMKRLPFEGFTMRLKYEKERMVQIIKWALPVGLQSIFFCFLSMLTSRMEAQFGATVVAVDRVGSRIESITWMIGGGYSSALVAYIGQNYGAKKWERIHRGVRLSLYMLLAWTGFTTLFLWFAGPWVFSLFLPEAETRALGTIFVRLLAFCQLANAFESVYSGAFTGAGFTIAPAVVVVVCNSFRVALAWFLSQTSLGVYGVFIGINIGAVMRGIFMAIWYFFYKKRLPLSSRN
jgi:putative MATE family efflux protein